MAFMLFAVLFDYRHIKSIAVFLYIGVIFLLIMVLLVMEVQMTQQLFKRV